MSDGAMICYVATHHDSSRRYVGVSRNPLNIRRSEHESQARNGTTDAFFHEALRAYGADSFSWRVVAEGEEAVIRLLENALIHTWHTNDPDHGFNSVGGAAWVDRPPLTEKPEDFAEITSSLGLGNVEVLDMLNDLDAIVGWVERNQPGPERCEDLRTLGNRLINRLDHLDASLSG